MPTKLTHLPGNVFNSIRDARRKRTVSGCDTAMLVTGEKIKEIEK